MFNYYEMALEIIKNSLPFFDKEELKIFINEVEELVKKRLEEKEKILKQIKSTKDAINKVTNLIDKIKDKKSVKKELKKKKEPSEVKKFLKSQLNFDKMFQYYPYFEDKIMKKDLNSKDVIPNKFKQFTEFRRHFTKKFNIDTKIVNISIVNSYLGWLLGTTKNKKLDSYHSDIRMYL